MKVALIWIDEDKGKIKKSSLECLSAVQGGPWTIYSCGLKTTQALKDELSSWAVEKHFVAPDGLETFNPEAYLEFMAQVAQDSKAELFLASSSTHGRDVFPRLAARLDCAYMSDVTSFENADNPVIKRPLFAGKCTAQVTFTDQSQKIVLLRPNQMTVVTPSQSAQTEVIQVESKPGLGRCQTLSIEQGQSEKLDLTEAPVIVSGGRGLKEAENFKLLEELAEPINATVGASRAVVDLGWVPHSQQVGQTGKTVAPTLYIAVGISGAIQHLAGMSGSKNIVAINKDEKAPIFQKATYGIVGDLFEVVPLLTEKLKSLK